MEQCAICDKDCTHHYFGCDKTMCPYCPECFTRTECGQGKHGEECSTQIFNTDRDLT